MVEYFPAPYPDELLYSVIARYHIRSANLSNKRTLRELFGKATVSAVTDLPCHISDLASNLPSYVALSPETLIINHTLFPYYATFLKRTRAKKVYELMKSPYGGNIHLFTGIMASSIRVPERMRYCPKCFQEDREKYGEYYWHRLHNTPGVEVCPTHTTYLCKSEVLIHNDNKHSFVAATQNNCSDSGENMEFNDNVFEKLLLFSQDVLWIYKYFRSLNNISNIDFRLEYLSLLDDKELLTENHRVRLIKLLRQFAAFYGNIFLEVMQSGTATNSQNNWLVSILRKHRRAFHPIRHLLTIRFLSGTPEKFFKEKTEKKSISKITIKHHNNSKPVNIKDKKAHRSQWIKAIQANPVLSKTELRMKFPSIYTWLYRHDKPWLNDNSPSLRKTFTNKSKVDWEQRDITALALVKEIVRQLQENKFYPARITMSLIGKKTGKLAYIQKHPDKTPLTIAYLNMVTETIEDYQIRRIRHIVAQLETNGETVKEWKIQRLAGLRPGYSMKVKKTISQIVEWYNPEIMRMKRTS